MESEKLKVESRAEHSFDFENLKVYQKALKFVNTVFTLSGEFPTRIQYSLGDQFRRAAVSIVNNIAEGSNKRTVKEKTQFYRFALDSARECVPMMTICRDQEFITQTTHDALRPDYLELCRMLVGLINAVNR